MSGSFEEKSIQHRSATAACFDAESYARSFEQADRTRELLLEKFTRSRPILAPPCVNAVDVSVGSASRRRLSCRRALASTQPVEHDGGVNDAPRISIVESFVDGSEKRIAFIFVHVVANVTDDYELELGALGQIRRLVDDDATVLHLRFERVHLEDSTTPSAPCRTVVGAAHP
jgi:hypothetical protein